jgi:hypothetical protein
MAFARGFGPVPNDSIRGQFARHHARRGVSDSAVGAVPSHSVNTVFPR